MKQKHLLTALLLLAVLSAVCTGCHTAGQQENTQQIFAMDTFMTLTACGPNSQKAVEAAVEEIRRLDALLSTENPNSAVSQLNVSGGGSLDPDVAALLSASLAAYQSTGGIFDPTIYPLTRLWGFPTQDYHIPTPAELSETLPLVNASLLQFDDAALTLAPGQQIDFGGIAKGYTAARIMDIFRKLDIKSGIVSLGGNVQVLGARPDGSPWRIGIQDPDAPRGASLAVLEIMDRAIVTSGGYERCFEEDGQTYIHILDPRTGYPADSDLLSATAVSEDGTLADVLSTSLYIMGLEGAEEYWRSSGESFEMVLLTDEKRLFVTEGLSGSLQSELMPEILYRTG